MRHRLISVSFSIFASSSSSLALNSSSTISSSSRVYNNLYHSNSSVSGDFVASDSNFPLYGKSSINSIHGTKSNNYNALQTVRRMTHQPQPQDDFDAEYPGTAVTRLKNVRARVATLTENDLSSDWEDVRRKLLWAGGLKDLPDAVPGQGYTGHSFNDYNHVDLTTMNDQNSDNRNNGEVKQIAFGNFLGEGIRKASIPELGPGGSWSTCANGCHLDPPQDVAHVQFRSRIAFKLVWVPNENFDQFVLVDDEGNELARGSPKGRLPPMRQRQMNYELVRGSKYARVVDEIVASKK